MNTRAKLIIKIWEDTGIKIPHDAQFVRPTLTWSHLSVGRFKWYWLQKDGVQIGSAENMRELIKAPKILCDFGRSHFGFYELSSS